MLVISTPTSASDKNQNSVAWNVVEAIIWTLDKAKADALFTAANKAARLLKFQDFAEWQAIFNDVDWNYIIGFSGSEKIAGEAVKVTQENGVMVKTNKNPSQIHLQATLADVIKQDAIGSMDRNNQTLYAIFVDNQGAIITKPFSAGNDSLCFTFQTVVSDDSKKEGLGMDSTEKIDVYLQAYSIDSLKTEMNDITQNTWLQIKTLP